MKRISFLSICLILASTAFADNEPREAICSVLHRQDKGYAAWISSSCSDYVEVEPNVFEPNQKACLAAMMQARVVAKNKPILQTMRTNFNKKELKCFIGVFKSGIMTVDQIEDISFFQN